MPFKKIFKPVRKVLDKIIPNEIKPALPYLAAFTPFLAPTTGFLGTMGGRALLAGGANIGAQLAQEGVTEDDLNLLSAGIAAATGALSAPGTSAKLEGFKSPTGDFAGARNIFQKGRDLGITGLQKAADFLSAAEGSGGVGDILRPGGTPMAFNKATATAVGVPLTQGVGDAMYTEAVQLSKQQIIDQALAGLDEGFSNADASNAIRLAMLQYGFSDDEISETITAAGYKTGGRVGYRFGGIDKAIEMVEEETVEKGKEGIMTAAGEDPMLVEEYNKYVFDLLEQRPNVKPMSFADFKRMVKAGMKDGGIMNAKRGLVDEPGGYAGEMPSIKEIWSKEGEDDPLGTIIKLGLTFRKPIIEIVNAIGVTASVAADLIAGVAKLGYDVTEPIRDVVGEVAGGIYDVGKDLVKGSKTDTRFIQPMYYLQRFGGDKALTDEETQLKMMSDSVGRDDPKKRRELENIVFGFDDAGMSQRPEDKEVSETIKFKEKYNFADGGLMNLGGKEMDLRGGGFVPIGKKERADDVPARLSKNEFVMTADAVRAAGGGSVNKGAKRMYNLMNTLEARA
jgi:hypothetical protein